MLEKVEVLYHSSIRLDVNIYIDPFKIDEEYHNARLVYITHTHYDHFSLEDIEKVRNINTKFIVPNNCKEKLLSVGVKEENIFEVIPNEKYIVDGISFETVRAYNVNKEFHKKEYNFVGYIITLNKVRYYISGDTDQNEDIDNVKCDVALVPIGGTYTMNVKEAAKYINKIHPKYVVPTHYNSIVGNKEDGEEFIKLIDEDIKYKLYL